MGLFVTLYCMNIVVQYRCQQCMSPMCLGAGSRRSEVVETRFRAFFFLVCFGVNRHRGTWVAGTSIVRPAVVSCRPTRPAAPPDPRAPSRSGAGRAAAQLTQPSRSLLLGRLGRLGACAAAAAAAAGGMPGGGGRPRWPQHICCMWLSAAARLQAVSAPTARANCLIRHPCVVLLTPTAPPPDPRQTVPRPCHHPGCACVVCAAGSLCPPTRTRPARPPAASPPPR